MIIPMIILKCILLLLVKQSIIECTENIVNTDLNTNVTLKCSLKEGVKVKWVHDGKRRSEILSNDDLFLAKVRKQDSGEYKCIDDHNDEVLSKIYLNVKTPPAVLDNVTVIPFSVLAMIHWEVKDNGGYPILNITVRYKLNDEKDEWHLNPHFISPLSKQVEVYKLNPNSSYLFQIWATNKLGPGEAINITAKTLYDIQEIELARHLLDGAETFDTRAWLAAVAIVMTTLLILTIGTCCVLFRDSNVSFYANEECDPERIELMPNVITNPGYYEELILSNAYNSETPEDEDEFTSYFASRSGARAVRV